MKLTQEQVDQFRRDGVLIAPNVMTDADQQPVINELSAVVDERARQLKSEGKISELHEDKPFETRFTYLYRQCKDIDRRLDIMQVLGKAMFAYLINDNLLNAVECLIGPEIACSPIQHVRPKVPVSSQASSKDLTGNVPWHQDAGVTLEEAEASDIVTVWMPLVNATLQTGCMQVLPGVFKRGYLAHVASDYGTMIDPNALPDVQPLICECPKGGAVFMSKHTPHMGLPNLTPDTVRWTIDLRYQKAGTPTGRPSQPDFIARSRDNPVRALRDHAEWVRLWNESHTTRQPQRQLHRVKA